MSSELAAVEPAGVKPRCGRPDCDEPAVARMYWPGRGRSLVCAEHCVAAWALASAIGFVLRLEAYPR